MKTFTSTFLFVALSLFAFSQDIDVTKSTSSKDSKTNSSSVYWSFSTEMIFSFANIDNAGQPQGNIMRWAPWFNPQVMANYDLNKNLGIFSGLAIRNVGFIYDNPSDTDNARYKYRTYNLAIPIGFKVGKMNSLMLFGGYEIEFPITYKEKRFVNEKKDKTGPVWFSDRVEQFQQSFLVGVQFPFGTALKFKYYITNFHNKDYEETNNGVKTKPYENLNANVFYFSLSWNLFTNWHEYTKKH